MLVCVAALAGVVTTRWLRGSDGQRGLPHGPWPGPPCVGRSSHGCLSCSSALNHSRVFHHDIQSLFLDYLGLACRHTDRVGARRIGLASDRVNCYLSSRQPFEGLEQQSSLTSPAARPPWLGSSVS